MNALRGIRILVAAAVFTLVTLFFLGFGGGCGLLEKVQIGPALTACALIPLGAWLILTLLFGRVYCSFVCPLGILQDVLARLVRLAGGRRLGALRHAPRKDHPWIRAVVLLVVTGLVLAGGLSCAALVDPYSAYGRLAAQVFQPAAEGVNNLLADGLGTEGAVVLFRRELFLRSVSGFVLAAVSLVLLLLLVAWKGRLFCNTLCPVGAVLGLLSRRTVFRIAFDSSKCVACGLCSASCKALCLDGKSRTVDSARCVRCFDCLNACPKGALSFGSVSLSRTGAVDTDRRALLTGGVAAAGAVAAVQVAPRLTSASPGHALPPPGATVESLRAACTACGLCVARCPRQALAPAGYGAYGQLTFQLPKMDFTRGFCRPDCTACGEVCPTGAIRLLDRVQKKATRIGAATWDRARCLVCTEKIPCGLCARRCPHGAITLKDEKVKDGGKTVEISIPVVDRQKCVGCGACEHYCPSHAMKIEGLK